MNIFVPKNNNNENFRKESQSKGGGILFTKLFNNEQLLHSRIIMIFPKNLDNKKTPLEFLFTKKQQQNRIDFHNSNSYQFFIFIIFFKKGI